MDKNRFKNNITNNIEIQKMENNGYLDINTDRIWHTEIHTDTLSESLIERQTDIPSDRQTYRQTYR